MRKVPLLSIALTPMSADDAVRLARGLSVLTAEDPTVTWRPLPSGDVVVGAIGELQLEIVVDRLKREFEVSAFVDRPRIGYTETVTREANGEMKYAKQALRQYAHVKLTVHPCKRGSGNWFENNLTGESIPAEYVPAVQAGIEEALDAGVLAGYPVQDIKVVLHDGSWHDVDSTDAAFRMAAGLALQDALKKATPIVLEPVMRIHLEVADDYKDDVVQGLVKRRVRLEVLEQRHQTVVIDGVGRLADLFGYAPELRATTHDRGSYTLSLHGYEPAPPRPDDEERGGLGVREPMHPRPSPRAGNIALPLDEA